MRAVSKNLNRPPASLAPNNLAAVIDITDPDHKDKIKQATYGNAVVVDKLKVIYRNKCAYCECYEPEPEVEHYRPKKRVTTVAGHPGYYWLCYEWSNLMPSCHDCNKTATKGNYFPVDGAGRVSAPTFLNGLIDETHNRLESNTLTVTEVPLLLNPEIQGYDPFEYFIIDNIGQFKPKNAPSTLKYRKAAKTIEVVRLNRDKLVLTVRKRAIRYYMKRLSGISARYLNKMVSVEVFENDYLTLLREIRDNSRLTDTSEHWFFWNFFLKNFKIYITYYFKRKIALGLMSAFDELTPII
ncbi:MAG: hypothetical protein ACXVAY_12810 [Mucilaginibacter sp.]